MGKTWVEWFQDALAKYRCPWHYLLESHAYMLPVIQAIRRHAPAPATLLEAGGGLGTTAAILAGYGYTVTSIEHDSDVLAMSRKMPWASMDGLLLCHGNAYNPRVYGTFEVATSLGLVEHEAPEGASLLLRGLASASRLHVVCAPSALALAAGEPTMGERPLTLTDLRALCEAAGWEIHEAFGWGDPEHLLEDRESLTRQDWLSGQSLGDHSLSLCVIGRR